VALGPQRLARADVLGVSPHDRVQVWLQATADLAAGASSSDRRVVPRLRPHGVADQVVVLTREALAAGEADADSAELARRAEVRRAEVARRLVALRRSL